MGRAGTVNCASVVKRPAPESAVAATWMRQGSAVSPNQTKLVPSSLPTVTCVSLLIARTR